MSEFRVSQASGRFIWAELGQGVVSLVDSRSQLPEETATPVAAPPLAHQRAKRSLLPTVTLLLLGVLSVAGAAMLLLPI